jgi:hypothetical protein
MEAKWDGTTTSMDQLKVKAYYGTSPIPIAAGAQAYASDGRKPGEGAGAGTGVLAYYDAAGAWVSVCDGTVVQA